MKIDKNSWHARVYRAWYKKYNRTTSEPTWVNLCPYMRTVLLWSWLYPLFISNWLTVFGKKLYTPVLVWAFFLIEVPRWAGMLAYNLKLAMYTTYAVFGVIVSVVVSLLWLADLFKRSDRVKQGMSSFADLTGGYVKSFHDKICPVIDLE